MANSRFYSSTAVANTLGATITAAATSLYFTTTPSGYPTSFPFTLVLEPNTGNMELVSVTSGSGTSGTPYVVTRAFDGTSAVSHNSGVTVQHDTSAFDFTTSRTHEASGSGSGVHGLPSAAWATSSFAQIGQNVLASATATITFSSIPQTYRHLLVTLQGRASGSGSQHSDVACQLNGDSGSNYSYVENRMTTESGSLVTSQNYASAQTAWNWFLKIAASGAGGAANAGGGWAFLPNYVGTTWNKSFVSQSGYGDATSNPLDVGERYGWYNPGSQVGISSLVLTCAQGNFEVGTVASVYGFGS